MQTHTHALTQKTSSHSSMASWYSRFPCAAVQAQQASSWSCVLRGCWTGGRWTRRWSLVVRARLPCGWGWCRCRWTWYCQPMFWNAVCRSGYGRWSSMKRNAQGRSWAWGRSLCCLRHRDEILGSCSRRSCGSCQSRLPSCVFEVFCGLHLYMKSAIRCYWLHGLHEKV